MLREQIMDGVKVAMKARDVNRLSVLRYMMSEIKNREIDAKHELSDEEVVELLRREVKRRSEAIDQFESGGRSDLANQEKSELAIIETFLPQLMTKEQVETIVDNVLAGSETKDFGSVMKSVMQEIKGKADGKLVSEVVKTKLS